MGAMGGMNDSGKEERTERDLSSISLWASTARVGQRPSRALPGPCPNALSSQHAAKQAAASATQTIAAAQHAGSTPKASAGPQPLLVQSCKVRLSGRW